MNKVTLGMVLVALLSLTGCTVKGNPSTAATSNAKVLCYVSNYNLKANTITIDEIEWISHNDTARISELGLDVDNDFPNDYYIYNKIIEDKIMKLAEDAKLFIVKGAEQEPVDKSGFGKRIQEYQAPYTITIQGGVIIKIEEQYVP